MKRTLLGLALVLGVNGYPYRFSEQHSDCATDLNVPNTIMGNTITPGSFDSLTLEKDSNLVTSYEPGAIYSVQVGTAATSRLLVQANDGTLDPPDPNCANRHFIRSKEGRSFDFEWTAPGEPFCRGCSDTADCDAWLTTWCSGTAADAGLQALWAAGFGQTVTHATVSFPVANMSICAACTDSSSQTCLTSIQTRLDACPTEAPTTAPTAALPADTGLQAPGFERFLSFTAPFGVVKEIGVSWTLDPAAGTLEVAFKAKDAGTLALGFAAQAGVMSGDAVIGYGTTIRSARLEGTTADAIMGPQQAKPNTFLSSQSITKVDGYTTVTFKRAVAGAGDEPVLMDGATEMIWAASAAVYGGGPTLHEQTAGMTINFATGVGATAAPPGISMGVVAALVCAGIVFVVAALLQLAPSNALLQTKLFHSATAVQVMGEWSGLSIGAVLAVPMLTIIPLILCFVLAPAGKRISATWGGFVLFLLMLSSLPVHKNSLWVHLLRLPFERAIKWHRMLAALTWTFGLLHLVFVLVQHGFVAFSSVQLGPSTPLFGTIAWLLMTVVVLTAKFLRRSNWPIFRAFHYLGPLSWVFVILHNRQPLTYALMGISFGLHALDRLIRSPAWCRDFSLVAAEALPGAITKLTLKTPEGFKFNGGDYCFLHCGTVSAVQWHPFSISSDPATPAQIEFHIKDMGEQKWTGKLRAHVADLSRIHVDGPYGKLSVKLDLYSHVFLVAGGIGITPMASILAQLADSEAHSRVQLLWSVRTGVELAKFRSLLDKVAEKKHVSARLFITKKTADTAADPAEDGLDCVSGRPDYQELFSQCAEVPPTKVCVLACGPAPLVASVQLEAKLKGFHFHKEIFKF